MPQLLALLPKHGLALPGIRANQMSQIQLGAPGALEDWRFHLQGPSVIFESPAGWLPGKRATGHGPRYVYSLPRADFYFQWLYEEGEDAREPIVWQDQRPPWRPAAALAEIVVTETAAANAAADEADARMATGLYRAGDEQAPAQVVGLNAPEPEVADPDDADDLPMTPAKKGRGR